MIKEKPKANQKFDLLVTVAAECPVMDLVLFTTVEFLCEYPLMVFSLTCRGMHRIRSVL